MLDPSYLRGVDDALAEVQRRLFVASKLCQPITECGVHEILHETANRLHGGSLIPRREPITSEVVHHMPYTNPGLVSCCGRTPFELPPTDRMTGDQSLVTCMSLIPGEGA